MDKGYVWFALNNSTTDYIELSRELAKSIKKFNKHNKVSRTNFLILLRY
jgi:hypothetical protein